MPGTNRSQNFSGRVQKAMKKFSLNHFKKPNGIMKIVCLVSVLVLSTDFANLYSNHSSILSASQHHQRKSTLFYQIIVEY